MDRFADRTRWEQPRGRRLRAALAAGGLGLAVLAGCQPTVRVEAPEKPIVINLNVKIEQDVRVRLEKDVEQVLDRNPEIF
jgi:hypothetical protein